MGKARRKQGGVAQRTKELDRAKEQARRLEDKRDNDSDGSYVLKVRLASLEGERDRLEIELQRERAKEPGSDDIPEEAVMEIINMVVSEQSKLSTTALAELRVTMDNEKYYRSMITKAASRQTSRSLWVGRDPQDCSIRPPTAVCMV